MYKEISRELLDFIEESPSCFHAIENIKKELEEKGYTELAEAKKWNLKKGGKYFTIRNSSSIIAFEIGKNMKEESFNIVASHSDSPSFKVKENFELTVDGKYMQLNTEKYGGMIYSTWLDRPLSLAGRVVVEDGDKLSTKLLNIDRDLLMIPNVAIHMNRAANNKMTYNEQIDLMPLFGLKDGEKDDMSLLDIIAEEMNIKKEDIIDHDLFLYNRMPASIWGRQNEFLSCSQLDDLQCAYTSLKSFIEAKNDKSVKVYACFDNEEVGSSTKQGAASTLLQDVLKRINMNLGYKEEDYYRALASSFMLSADNAHAVHPNHPEKSDPKNRVYMNEGLVIKFNANQRYTTDGISASVFKKICKNADVPVQFFTNRSDMVGGGTLGNCAIGNVSIKMVDIGLAQLAMHSSYETAGVKDTYYMVKAITEFYSTKITENACGELELKK